MKPVVAITRPIESAQGFFEELRLNCGSEFEAVISPSYKIEFSHKQERLCEFEHLIFTSMNGVRAANAMQLRCEGNAWCVGDETSKLAASSGFQAVSADGDAASLLKLVTDMYDGGRILHISGEHSRLDFSVALSNRSIPCKRLVAYSQEPLAANAALVDSLMGSETVVLPLFSARAAMILDELEITAPLHIVAISKAVVEAVSKNISATYIVADKPKKQSMIESTCRVLEYLSDASDRDRTKPI